MKRRKAITTGIGLLLILGLAILVLAPVWNPGGPQQTIASPTAERMQMEPPNGLPNFRIPPANPVHTTAALHEMLLNLSQLSGMKTVPLGINEDLARVLRGNNPFQQPLLSLEHPAWSPDYSTLRDPYGTPYHLHALGEGRYELRSAGPDRRLFSEDDEVIR